jgi:hypothetical protein
MGSTRIVLGLMAGLAWGGCTDRAQPVAGSEVTSAADPDSSVVDTALGGEHAWVGGVLASPCHLGTWGPGLDHLRDQPGRVLVDVAFERPASEGPADGLRPDEIGWIEAHGGTVLHRFEAPLVRARLPVARLEALVAGEAWVTVRAVPDPMRTDVPVEVLFDGMTADDLVGTLGGLGGRVTRTYTGLPLVEGIVPDHALPALAATPGVARIRLAGIYCVTR